MAYGIVNWDQTALRYTTLEAIKDRLGIDALNTEWDAQLLEAGIASEVALDAHLGRSFPDVEEPESPAVITAVPQAVAQAALQSAVGVFQAAGAPYGTGGADSWALGSVSIPDLVRDVAARSPMLVGLQVSWGIA